MNNNLDYFGKILMQDVRDESIEHWEGVLKGEFNDLNSKIIFKKINHLSSEDKKELMCLITQVVDITLHNFLWTVEQNGKINIIVTKDYDDNGDIKSISDGLAGELYSEDGWKSIYSSKENFDE